MDKKPLNFSMEKDVTVLQAVELMFQKLADWKVSSFNGYVMVRNVSCLFYNGKVYFDKQSVEARKYDQEP